MIDTVVRLLRNGEAQQPPVRPCTESAEPIMTEVVNDTNRLSAVKSAPLGGPTNADRSSVEGSGSGVGTGGAGVRRPA